MSSRATIDEFLALPAIAVAGVSRDKKRFGWQVYEALNKGGRKIYPLNPKYTDINGEKCYSSIAELPEKVRGLLVVTGNNNSAEIVRQGADYGIEYVWIQQMSDSPEALKIAEENNLKLIKKECIMMFAEPVKIVHRFHRGLWKIIGKYPKN